MKIDNELLKEQNNLTIGDNGEIYILPNDNGYTSYPLDSLEGCIALTQEEYILLKANYLRINKDKTGVELNLKEESEVMENE